ncbi:uncharacterized protein LOC126647142 isoform X3 [Myiozetetes cayanensis]|uniref:uncharacterized protein LOC126647142 isoform X3 n=1 Tax=Myiozetetes cayanensis TaxID=478635 RepID=UPI002160AD05|nr:uncharacterized protein LOC126647142 isoform X3 [Myiozetetes cayanensis]
MTCAVPGRWGRVAQRRQHHHFCEFQLLRISLGDSICFAKDSLLREFRGRATGGRVDTKPREDWGGNRASRTRGSEGCGRLVSAHPRGWCCGDSASWASPTSRHLPRGPERDEGMLLMMMVLLLRSEGLKAVEPRAWERSGQCGEKCRKNWSNCFPVLVSSPGFLRKQGIRKLH